MLRKSMILGVVIGSVIGSLTAAALVIGTGGWLGSDGPAREAEAAVLVPIALEPVPEVQGSSVLASVPELVNFQGLLTDAGGIPVADGLYTVTFRVFDVPAGGTALCTDIQDVDVNGGLFHLLLPFGPPCFTGSSWLEVKVGTDPPLSPRQQFVSAPYAFHAETADTANSAKTAGTATSASKADLANDVSCIGCVDSGDIADGTITQADLGAGVGGLLSTRQTKVSSPTNLGTSWSDLAGLFVTITPASSGSKFLIFVSSGSACQSPGCGSSGEWALRLVRNGTVLQTLVSDEGGAEGRSAMHPITFTYLDQPATASPVTYKIQGRAFFNGVFRVPGGVTKLGEQSDAVITIIELQ